MLSPVIAICRRVLQSLLASDSPNQLAAGFTLGMIIGLVPKGNFIAVSLCVLLFSLRVNKGLALVAAVLFSAIGPFADSFSHKLGMALLTTDALQPPYAMAFSLPLAPWLEFHNTVVAGTLTLGLYIAYPVYWISGVLCKWLQPFASEWIKRHRAMGTLVDAKHDPVSRAAA
jgi:uncharacterized protein (TIGR03546 family)